MHGISDVGCSKYSVFAIIIHQELGRRLKRLKLDTKIESFRKREFRGE